MIIKQMKVLRSIHVYKVRPRRDKRGVNLISDALPFGCLWRGEPDAISDAIGYAKFRSRLHDAAIRVYDAAGNVSTRTSNRTSSKRCEFCQAIWVVSGGSRPERGLAVWQRFNANCLDAARNRLQNAV